MKFVVGIFFISIYSNAIGDLLNYEKMTEEQLTPFCKNKMIWDPLGIKFDQCLKASLHCSDEVSKKKLDFMEGGEEFNMCILDQLGIVIPDE